MCARVYTRLVVYGCYSSLSIPSQKTNCRCRHTSWNGWAHREQNGIRAPSHRSLRLSAHNLSTYISFGAFIKMQKQCCVLCCALNCLNRILLMLIWVLAVLIKLDWLRINSIISEFFFIILSKDQINIIKTELYLDTNKYFIKWLVQYNSNIYV